MKNRMQNLNIDITAQILALFFAFSYFVFSAYAFWNDGVVKANSSGLSVINIGAWLVNSDISRLNERVSALVESDSLLAWDENMLWIAGDKTDSRSPAPKLPDELNLPSAVLKAGTVLAWQSTSASVVTVQTVKDVLYEEYVQWFISWESLEAALNKTPYLIGGTSGSDFVRFCHGKIYTTAHAPVLHEGNYYLARHDNVTSAPEINGNSDWFFVSDLYVPQDYPAGSLVEHNGRHFRKLSSNINDEPGKNAAGWRLLDYTLDKEQEIVVWSRNQTWRLNDIVTHIGQYFICILDGSTLEPNPDLPVIWEEIPECSESEFTAPDWRQNGAYFQNDVVVFQNEYYIAQTYIENSQINPAADINWQHVVQYIPENTVPAYVLGKGYEPYAFVLYTDSNDTAGYFVSPSGANDTLPGDKNGPWIPVSSWNEETSGVEDWGSDRQYIDRDLGMFVYYAGEIYRFEGKNPPKGKTPQQQANSWSRIPKWSEIAGRWRGEETICSKINNKYVIWKLNTEKAFSAQNQPQEPVVGISGNDDWFQYEKACTSQYVYTTHSGRIVLWYNENPSNIAPGASNSPWTEVVYKTEKKYVYTVNAAGAVKVWYSENESSVPPGVNLPEWRELYSSIGAESFPFFYIKKEGKTHYYETRIMDAAGNLQPYLSGKQYAADSTVLWFEAGRAWIGGNVFAFNQNGENEKNAVAYHWNSRNIYLPGEIVAYGITRTNTYSYYRLRENVNPYVATNREPSSYSGYLYWEPLNVIGSNK